MGGERTQTAPSHAQFTHLEEKKKERIIKKRTIYANSSYIACFEKKVTGLRRDIQSKKGKKERRKKKKLISFIACLII